MIKRRHLANFFHLLQLCNQRCITKMEKLLARKWLCLMEKRQENPGLDIIIRADMFCNSIMNAKIHLPCKWNSFKIRAIKQHDNNNFQANADANFYICMWLSLQPSHKDQGHSSRCPHTNENNTEEIFIWKDVFYLSQIITVIYSKDRALRMTLTSVGSGFTPKCIMLPLILLHEMYSIELICQDV